MIYVISFLFLIGVLVAVHEGGHFLAARALGIHVTDFSLGMGPKLIGWHDKKGCQWKICMFPLGGYVKMLGDLDISSKPGVPTNQSLPENYKSMFIYRSWFDRALVIFAGPAANIIFGFLLILGIHMTVGHIVVPPIVGGVEKGTPAAEAGILPGDKIISINGTQINKFDDLIEKVSVQVGLPIDIKILRDGKIIPFNVIPASLADSNHHHVGRIGISSTGDREFESEGFLESIRNSGVDSVKISLQIYQGVWQTISGQRSLKDMGGPIKIAEVSGDTWIRYGMLPFILLMAAISFNLAIVNLLPLPVLDGGHLLLYFIEAIRGKPASTKMVNGLFKGGAIALGVLFILITYSDISGVIHRIWSE